MDKILSISLKLNYTPNTLGRYELNGVRFSEARMSKIRLSMVRFKNVRLIEIRISDGLSEVMVKESLG